MKKTLKEIIKRINTNLTNIRMTRIKPNFFSAVNYLCNLSIRVIRVQAFAFCFLVLFQTSIGYGAEEHAAHHAAEFKPLTEAFRIINFLVVFGTLYYLLSKHIKNFFAGRREDIVKSLNDAEQLKSSAQKRLSELESKIKEMKNTVLQMIEDARREGKHTKDNIIGSANESSKKIMEKAKKEIEYETKIVMERLRAEALELTIKMAENILKKSVTKNDHVSMVNECIKGIGTGEARLG